MKSPPERKTAASIGQNNTREKKTTKGWHLLVEWFDGTNTWEILASLKESHPMQVADYSKGEDLLNEPEFALWFPT